MAYEPTHLGVVTVRAYPTRARSGARQLSLRLPTCVGQYLDAEGARVAVEHDPTGLRLRATTDSHVGAVANYSVATNGEIHLGEPVIDALGLTAGDDVRVGYGEPGAWVTLRPVTGQPPRQGGVRP